MQKLVDNTLVDWTDEDETARAVAQAKKEAEKVAVVSPTKEQLLAQLQALQAQINALG